MGDRNDTTGDSMTVELFWSWLPAFIATYWIETPYLVFFGQGKVDAKRVLWQSLLLQATTHPLLWLSFGWLMQRTGSYVGALIVGEAVVFAIEVVFLMWLWRPHRRTALSAAVVANVSSMCIGLLVYLGM